LNDETATKEDEFDRQFLEGTPPGIRAFILNRLYKAKIDPNYAYRGRLIDSIKMAILEY